MQADAPRVSVVIPAYNREAYVGEAIESALAQKTEFPFEVIVTDDCSTDGTVDVARAYGAQVRVLTSTENRGLSANRNAAIRAARGEFIALLDDDDRMLPGRLREQVGFLEANPEVDFALGLCEFESGETPPETYFASRGMQIPWGEWQIFEQWRPILLRHYIGSPSASTFRRTLFDRIGLYDEHLRFWEDVEFLARAATQTPIACYNAPVAWRRTSHADRLTTSSDGVLRLPDQYAALLATLPELSDEERAELGGKYQRSVHHALGTSLTSLDRRDAQLVLSRHGQAIDPWARRKWYVVTSLPWRLMRRVVVLRGQVAQR